MNEENDDPLKTLDRTWTDWLFGLCLVLGVAGTVTIICWGALR